MLRELTISIGIEKLFEITTSEKSQQFSLMFQPVKNSDFQLQEALSTVSGITNAGQFLVINFENDTDLNRERIHFEKISFVKIGADEVQFELNTVFRSNGAHYYVDTLRNVDWNQNGWLRFAPDKYTALDFKVSVFTYICAMMIYLI